MILAFDVGNTETVMGLFETGDLLDSWRFATATERTTDEIGLLVRSLLRESGFSIEVLRAASIGSVVPPVTPILAESCERHLGVDVLIVDARTALPIRVDIEEPLSVGADRIANTLAAARLYKRDTIAVDLGTATTFDCISADGTFVGGIIAPGVQTGAETLVRRTAKLPRIDLERPAQVIGKRTETAMRSGIFYGAVDAIDGIVRRIKDEWGKRDAYVVATGGLATVIGPHCRTVERIEPNLTLFGLEMAYRYIEEKRSGGRLTPVRKASSKRG
jgi:type III pantothenate kinase